jgi:mercuric ion transport protein
MTTTVKRDVARLTTGGAVVAATCAALCCAGAPIIVSVLAATGLSFLRDDAILFPVIAIALAAAMWGFWRGRAAHGANIPILIGALGAIALPLGVVVLHGVIAKVFIGVGAVLLLIATIWNATLPPNCDQPVPLSRARP